jgi:hypothetical protein
MHFPSTQPRRGGGVVAAVLHDLLRLHHYDSYADVAADLKARCAVLHIAYDAAVVTSAIRQVEQAHGVPAVALAVAARTPRPREVDGPPEAPVIDRTQAAIITTHLRKRWDASR